MKISFISNANFAPCGYGQIVKNLLPKIHPHHPSSLIANYGLMGGNKIENFWEGMTFYGPGEAGFEEGMAPNHVKDFGGQVVIPIYDIWAWQQLPLELAKNRIPLVPYAPVDSEELNPFYRNNLQHCFKIIPMSQHSEDCIRKYFPDKTLPHIFPGVDLNVFKPLWDTVEEKNKLKRYLHFSEDTFLIGLMGDIKGDRKRWVENLEGISIFRKRNPQIKIGVYIHTSLRSGAPGDYQLKVFVDDFKLNDVVRIVDTYSYVKGISNEEMCKIYSCLDVFQQCSYGEGAGMMFVESAACGTPSLGTNFSSMKQAVADGKSGYLVNTLYKPYDTSGARKAMPDPEDIANKLELIYNKGSTSFKQDCLDHASQFEWNKLVQEKWLPMLAQLEKDIEYACFTPPPPSEELQKKGETVVVL